VAPNCEICGTPGHTPTECHLLGDTDHANYAHGNPYGQRNPNFPYKNKNPTYAQNPAPIAPPGFQGQRGAPVAPVKSNLELMMENFVMAQSQQNKEFLNQNIHTNEMIKKLASKVDTLATHNKMLETQIAQVAQQRVAAPSGTFPAQPQPNPKGELNVVTLRSGKELGSHSEREGAVKESVPTESEEILERKEGVEEEKEKPYVPPPPLQTSDPIPSETC